MGIGKAPSIGAADTDVTPVKKTVLILQKNINSAARKSEGGCLLTIMYKATFVVYKRRSFQFPDDIRMIIIFSNKLV